MMLRMPRAPCCASLALAALVSACAAGERSTPPPRATVGAFGPDVVGRVDGQPIRASEVDHLAEVAGLPAQTALSRLTAERLLEDEAERRGYGARTQTEYVARQASVQTLLERAVEQAPQTQVSQTEIDAAYAAARDRFEVPELRTATHVLAALPQNASAEQERAARAFCASAIRRLQTDPDREATLEDLRAEQPGDFQVQVQQLPASPAQGMFVPEFAAALFSLTAPGVVPEPVRTQFGYHAILVTDIAPAHNTPRSEADAALRSELETKKRKARIDAVLGELKQRTRVKYGPDGSKLLAELEL
jgi:peptidyl-prolyl cis-trans isomerase C